MKILKQLLLIVALVTYSFYSNAQTVENPWAIAAGVDLINLQGDNVDSGMNFGAPALSLSRYIGAGFSIGAQFALNNVKNNNAELDYSSIDGVVKYNLTDGKIIPYLFAGYGFSKFGEEDEKNGLFPSTETNRTGLGGIGVNFFLDDNFAINLSTSYRGNVEGDTYNHLQHIVGLSYNFGAGDADKDGVPDQKDECPDVPGLKEFNGCPDTDGDGIIDGEDDFPIDPNYQTDTDGDGIPNKTDPDDDNDGLEDGVDPYPLDPTMHKEHEHYAKGGCQLNGFVYREMPEIL
mgnify:CR=1 FL=1